MVTLTGLHTKHEMRRLAADRTWQRWVQSQRLAPPARIDGFNQKVRLFSEASLVPVLCSGRRRTDGEVPRAIRAAEEETRRLFATAEFVRIAEALRRHLRELPAGDMRAVGTLLQAVAPQAVAELSGAVERHETALARRSIEFLTLQAVIVDIDVSDALVRLRTDAGERLDVGVQRCAADQVLDTEVTVKQVQAEGLTGTFVLPSATITMTHAWKARSQQQLDTATSMAASDHGSVERPYAFLYLWDADAIEQWKIRATAALQAMDAPAGWDTFLAETRQRVGVLPLASVEQPTRREPAGMLADGSRRSWERELLDAPDLLAALPQRRRG